MQQVLSTVLDGAQPVEEVCELFDKEFVDPFDLLNLLAIVAMMRDLVVAVFDIHIGIAAVAASIADHEGGDSGAVGLKRQRHNVEHQAGVQRELTGDAIWNFVVGNLNKLLCSPINPLFHFRRFKVI